MIPLDERVVIYLNKHHKELAELERKAKAWCGGYEQYVPSVGVQKIRKVKKDKKLTQEFVDKETIKLFRLYDMYYMKMDGKSLEEIGQRHGFTREYVRQILQKELGMKMPRANKGSLGTELTTRNCIECETPMIVKPSSTKKWCSKDCRLEVFRKNPGYVKTPSKDASLEEKREYQRLRAKIWLQHQREDPAKLQRRKEKVKMYNDRAVMRKREKEEQFLRDLIAKQTNV